MKPSEMAGLRRIGEEELEVFSLCAKPVALHMFWLCGWRDGRVSVCASVSSHR